MNETVYVEFFIEASRQQKGKDEIAALGTDFVCEYDDIEFSIDVNGYTSGAYVKFGGKMDSMTASMLKLRSEFLAERMVVSYISEDLKNKYRK